MIVKIKLILARKWWNNADVLIFMVKSEFNIYYNFYSGSHEQYIS